MSYILEALKKSEKERTAGAVPSLQSSDVGPGRGAHSGWLVALVVVFVAVAAAAGMKLFWMKDSGWWSSKLTIDTSALPVPPATGTAGDAGARPNLSDQQPAVKGTVNALAVSELDPSAQQRFPELVIDALSYSTEQSKRFVMINQNIFKEGEELGNGLSVEQITPYAVILKFEDVWITLKP